MFAKQRRRRTPLKSARPRISAPRSFPYNHTPLRWDLLGVALSFLWGLVARIPLPRPLRVLLFKAWAYCYKCRLDELAEPLEQHRSLSEFFSRRIRADVRPVCPFGMSSPVDGRVVSCGEIGDEQMLEQVKGKSYTTAHFFGPEYAKITDHRVNPDT
jgi:phosphatidylserine decarboxylase